MYALNDGRLLKLRRLDMSDLDELLLIENSSFEFPWSREDFIRCLNCTEMKGMAATLDGSQILGFSISDRHKVTELINLAVLPEFRRLGVGRALVENLKNNYHALGCLIRETNLPAHLFFKNQDFLATEIYKSHFENNEDAYCFVYKLKASRLSPELVDAVIDNKY